MERYAAQYRDPLTAVAKFYPRLFRFALARGIEPDDIRSICWMGVIRGVKVYRENLTTSISSYFALCMRSEIYKAIKATTAEKRTAEIFSLDIQVGDRISIKNLIRRDEPESFLDVEKLRRVLVRIKPEWRKVVAEKWGLEDGNVKTIRDAAKNLGISKSRVTQIDFAARSLLAHYLQEIP